MFSIFILNCTIYREKICCGIIFKGPNGELLLDSRFLKPCDARLQMCKLRSSNNAAKAQTDGTEPVVTKGYNDNSSDSGYDESSNQGSAEFKKEVQPVSISQINTEIPMVN